MIIKVRPDEIQGNILNHAFQLARERGLPIGPGSPLVDWDEAEQVWLVELIIAAPEAQ